MTHQKIIGVDMGGTKIQAGLIAGNTIIAEKTNLTPSTETETKVLAKLTETIEAIITPDCIGIGIGVPSIVDPENGIVYDTMAIPSWKEVHLKKRLENHFGIPVKVDNDSNCFALGENYFGNGTKYANFIGLTLGTGLGVGIIIDHKLYRGSNTGAGEIGSISYKDGIIEQYCASQFFTAHGLNGEMLFTAARQQDKKALSIFREYAKNLSQAVKIMLYAYDPQAIIIGGSISNAFEFYSDALWSNLNDFLYPNSLKKLKIIKTELSSSALLGAAALLLTEK